MRRSTRLRLAIALLLLAGIGAYCAYWYVAAGKIAEGIAAWAHAMRDQKLDLSWRAMRVGGFPFSFRIELADAELRDEAISPAAELRAPLLWGSARPWNFQDWALDMPDGLSAAAGPRDQPLAKLTARTASGAVAVGGEGGATIWLSLGDAGIEAGEHIAARTVHAWLILPPRAPQTHTERNIALAADLREVTLPQVPVPFHNPVDDLAFGVTVRGAIPAAPARQAATAWRDSGGTVELDHFGLRWDTLAVTGSGTLALGPDLQPIGGFSGAVEGYDELMTALVAAGRIRASDARLAHLALAMLAKTGPEGRPQLPTSFTIQNGEMYLGPAKLGPVPRIAWE